MTAFLPTTFYFPEEPDQLREQLNLKYTDITQRLNSKDIGSYELLEVQNGQTWFGDNPRNKREAFRKVINFGVLPNATSKSVAHGINFTANYQVTKILGVSTSGGGFNAIPLPFASPVLANNISVEVDGTNVTVTTGINRPGFSKTVIVLEYLKS